MNRGERKVEVFDANLHEVSCDAHRSYDVAEMRRRLEVHLRWYDHARAHHALGGQLVPADRYYGRSAEVLACIEAGAGRDAGDGVALRERCLEPFNVQGDQPRRRARGVAAPRDARARGRRGARRGRVRALLPDPPRARFAAATRRVEATFALSPAERHDADRQLADRLVVLA